MSARMPRGRILPLVTGLAVAAVSAAVVPVIGTPSAASTASNASNASTSRAASTPWWLAKVDSTAAWRYSRGAGVTVAILSTGVDATHPDLAGSVTTGPDESHSGRVPGGPFWGTEGTAVASLVAGHDGIAPDAKILSLRVTLEYNDPLNSDADITRHLPDAIAAGIDYAVSHGARIIDLPLDPGTLGLNAAGQRTGDRAAAGGSQAEAAAVQQALAHGVVLVAPAGDDGMNGDTVNFPAAYHGVIGVGAITQAGTLATYSSHRPYVALLAPGTRLRVATPPSGFTTLSTTDNAAALVAGIAALIRSRYPALSVAQVTSALERGGASGTPGAPGTGFGLIDAGRALHAASLLAAPASKPSGTATPPVRAQHKRSSLAARITATSGLAGTVVRYTALALVAVIVLLGAVLMLGRARRGLPLMRGWRDAPRGTHARGARKARDAAADDPWRGVRTTGTRTAGTITSGTTATGSRTSAAMTAGPGTTGPGTTGRRTTGRRTGAARIRASRMSGARPGDPIGSGSLGLAPPASRAGRPTLAPVPKNRKNANRGPARPPWDPAPAPADVQRTSTEVSPGVIGLTGASTAPVPPFTAPQAREPFAAAPIPVDLPEWALWNPNASTDVFPKITDHDEGSGSGG